MKNVLKQFNQLKSIKADEVWKNNNREILLNQIANTQATSNDSAFNWGSYVFNLPINAFRAIPQSAMIVVFIFMFVVGGGFFSLQAAQNSVPGDSLYVAKIAGEKTQFALTFDDKSKARLGLEFAEKRAKEIDQVLAKNETSEEAGNRVEKLVVNFKKEISGAQLMLEKINQNSKVAINNENKDKDSLEQGVGMQNTDEEIEVQMFSANLGKDDNGIEVFDGENTSLNSKETGDDVADTDLIITPDEASTTNATTEMMAIETEVASDPREIIKQAKDLLNNDDIDATLSLIKEAGDAIDQVSRVSDVEENSGDSNATTTENISGDEATEGLDADGAQATTSADDSIE